MAQYLVIDSIAARRAADRLDLQHGAIRYRVEYNGSRCSSPGCVQMIARLGADKCDACLSR